MPYSENGAGSRKGYTKGKKRRERKKMRSLFKGPFTVKELTSGTKPVDKHDVDTRQLDVRTIPSDPNSLTISRRYRILAQPKRPIDVLRTKHFAEEAIAGNNMTTGVQKYALWRGLLDGPALASFQRHTTATGNETNDNLKIVVRNWLKDMLPVKVLPNHQRYLRNNLEKPYNIRTKAFAGLVEELNSYCQELPPNFNEAQKVNEDELREHIAKALPKKQQEILRQNGVDPRTTSMEDLVEIAERAQNDDDWYGEFSSSSSESEDEKPKARKKNKSSKSASKPKAAPKKDDSANKFFCELHKANPTHNSEDCWELQRRKREGTKRNKKDYKKELHLLETKLAQKNEELKASNIARDREQKKFNEFVKKSNKRDDDDVDMGSGGSDTISPSSSSSSD